MKDATPKPRQLKISILRFNPQEPGSVPRMQTYEIEEAAGMTLFIALNEIREKQEPSLQFDFVCRAGICGSCGMMINGRPTLACRTLTKSLEPEISLAPLPVFELIADLSVNTGKWMRDMSERLEAWVHMKETGVDLRGWKKRWSPSWRKKSMSSTAASSAAAASPAAAQCACVKTLSARWDSTKSPVSVSIPAITEATRTFTN